MELIRETIAVEDVVHSEQGQILVDGDIIVPDVKPDILKILQVDATAVISNKEISEGKLVLHGCVNLKILYIPDKQNDNIKSITTSFEFSHKIEKQAIMEGMIANTSVDVDRIEFRLINSRKLTVKSIVGLDINICGSKNMDIVTGVEGDGKVEIVRLPVKICSVATNCERELVLKDCVEVPAGKSSICEVLKVDSKISDKDMKAVTGKAVVKGVVNTSILYVGESNQLEFMEVDLPFTEVFDVDDIGEGVDCEIDYDICDLYYDVAEDNDGDKRIVNLEFVIGAKIKATENIEIDIVDDCYMPCFETQLEKEEFVLDEIVCQPRLQNTLREIVSIDRGMPQISGVYHVVTKCNILKTSVEHGKVCVEGKIDSYILYLSDSTESPVYSYKKEIPFSYAMESPNSESGMECYVKAEIEHTSYSLNVASEVELRIILCLSAKVIKKRKLDLIKDAQVVQVSGERKKGIVIYFIQKGDTMWNIAKRYKVAIDDIVQFNDISVDEKLSVGKQLIIPT